MNYNEAHQMAASENPVRRPSWPEGHHVRHHVEESVSKLKMHTPDQPEATDWTPGAEDEAAQDWEQYIPQQKAEGQAEGKVEEQAQEQPQGDAPESKAKHKK